MLQLKYELLSQRELRTQYTTHIYQFSLPLIVSEASWDAVETIA